MKNCLALVVLIAISVSCREGVSIDQRLVKAAFEGDTNAIQVAIKEGADVNAVTSGGRALTPILWAASRCNIDAVELLISNGALISVPDSNGDSLLYYLVTCGDMAEMTIKRCLQKGATWGSETNILSESNRGLGRDKLIDLYLNTPGRRVALESEHDTPTVALGVPGETL